MSHEKPFIDVEHAGRLARVGNRIASSFDAAELSSDEAFEVYLVLDRLMSALWESHQSVLLPVYAAFLKNRGLLDDDEVEGDEDSGEDDV